MLIKVKVGSFYFRLHVSGGLSLLLLASPLPDQLANLFLGRLQLTYPTQTYIYPEQFGFFLLIDMRWS